MCAAKKKSKPGNCAQQELRGKDTGKNNSKYNGEHEEVDDKLIGDDREIEQAQHPQSGKGDRKREIKNNNY